MPTPSQCHFLWRADKVRWLRHNCWSCSYSLYQHYNSTIINNMIKKRRNPYIHLLSIFRHYTPSKKKFILMIAFTIISKMVRLIEPYIFGQVINTIQVEWQSWLWKILQFLGLYVIVWLIGRWFHWFARIREQTIQFTTNKAFMSDLFAKINALPMARHTDNHSWQTIDKGSKATNALKNFAWDIHMHFHALVTWIWSGIALFFIRWPAGIIVTCVLIVTIIIINRFDNILHWYLMKQNKAEHTVMSTLFDFLSNSKTIISLRFQHRALETLRTKIQDVFPFFKKYIILNERKRFSADIIYKLFIIWVIWLYIYTQFQTQGIILLGTLTMLWQYTERMQSAFDNFTWLYWWLMEKSTYLATVDDIHAAYDALDNPHPRVEFDQQHPLRISNLNFSYRTEGNTQKVLNNIAIDLIPGKNIALVWSSWSGKSTLMMLLRWLYDVDHVDLSIGEEQYHSLAPLSHYASLIPQDPEIFEQTIKYNIHMWLDIDDETLIKMCDIARFSEVIAQLPQWLDTDIKEKWVNLSGGQKQRLALARWLLMAKESSLILLDESTSSVDTHNEKRIYEQIFEHFDHACIVASIHKLHLLPYFDYIYVLEHWEIQESGRLSELLTLKNGALNKLWETYHNDKGQLI